MVRSPLSAHWLAAAWMSASPTRAPRRCTSWQASMRCRRWALCSPYSRPQHRRPAAAESSNRIRSLLARRGGSLWRAFVLRGRVAEIVRVLSLRPWLWWSTLGCMARRVVLVVFPDLQLLDLGGPLEVF